jgi:SAM-dependent methyltransferase
MDVASIPDLSLAECLQILRRHFDLDAIAERRIDADAVLEYYRQSDRGYRLFHSKEGALHVALNCDEEFSTHGYQGQVELIAKRLQRGGAANILEIGCGNGYNTRNLAERLSAAKLVGIDLSLDHIKNAVNEARDLKNINFEQGDFHQLRFADVTFDAVFAVECLCQGTDWRTAIREASRVLRPGGQFIVIDCFRCRQLSDLNSNTQLATRLVEKTMAVEEFALFKDWLHEAQNCGLNVSEQLDLTEAIGHNVARFYSLARRYFKMPLAARAFLKAFPPRLIENAIAGLLMPFTVASGVHGYYLLALEKE